MHPGDEEYLDEASVRHELSRVFDVCDGCRRCVGHCDSFPRLFDALDRLPGDHGAGDLTPAAQDDIVDGCVQCGSCIVGCPYSPTVVEHGATAVDVPAVMRRATAMRRAGRQTSARDRRAARLLVDRRRGRRSVSSRTALVRRVLGGRPGSLWRRTVAAVTGISAWRAVSVSAPPVETAPGGGDDRVALVPTCIGEHYAPHLVQTMVDVYARRGVTCDLVDIGCCGLPARDAGDRRAVRAAAARVLTALRPHVAAGSTVVVAQSACARMIAEDLAAHLGDSERSIVTAAIDVLEDLAARTTLAAGADGGRADAAGAPDAVFVALDRRGAPPRSPTVRILGSLGATVAEVRGTCGVESIWGWRSDNDRNVESRMNHLAAALDESSVPGQVVVAESWLAAEVLAERLGIDVRHPVEVVDEADRRRG